MGGQLSACACNCSRNLKDDEMVQAPTQQRPPLQTSTLVYVERGSPKEHGDCSTSDGGGSRRRSSVSTHSSAKRMHVLQAQSQGIEAISVTRLDKVKLAAFRESLELAGLDTSRWGLDGSKSVEHLFWEAFEQRGCVIVGKHHAGHLKRVTRLVKIRLIAEIFGVEHTLFSRMQFMHDGQYLERKQVPLRKLVWSGTPEDSQDTDVLVYAENCPYTEDWETGCKKVLEERLGLNERWQEQHLEEDLHAYTYRTEDNCKSAGYPGLVTLYCIHEVTFRIVDPAHPNVQCIGLPEGKEFATREGDFNFTGQQNEDGLPIGTQLNIWMWDRSQPASPAKSLSFGPAKSDAAAPRLPVKSEKTQTTVRSEISWNISPKPPAHFKRVPVPQASTRAMSKLRGFDTAGEVQQPSSALRKALHGQMTDWSTVKQMAKRISDPKYTLQQFTADLVAFPELNLYLLQDQNAGELPGEMTSAVSSGRTTCDEYQRTVGAFFAIYWLLRLHHDGKEGFSFGVDENWVPFSEDSTDDRRLFPADKRVAFFKDSRWDYFRRLLVEAGLIEEKKKQWQVNEKRVVSLLVLTAIHDIMKMEVLLPTVDAAHAPYHDYAAGDTIGDHDHALSYLMEHYPHLLPSFNGLDPDEKRSVMFTQCQLCFNHGWFVQAEAPPGAVFTRFKEVLVRDHRSELGSRDVAFYFVHWLTDLAGAEPTPLGGCEKFVVKFPLAVLNSFLRSFEFVEKVPKRKETEVMEEYLKIRWAESVPSPGPPPSGESAVAKMRLLCMAQMNAAPVLKDLETLPEEDREVLFVEMSRSGCLGQCFSDNLVPREVNERILGPAFLVYYGPAFLQSLGSDSAARRLSMLAEVYRCARELWPAAAARAAFTVIVRIDTIKSLRTDEIMEAIDKGDFWVMVKHNESEAFIERSSQRKMNKFIADRQCVQILDFAACMSW